MGEGVTLGGDAPPGGDVLPDGDAACVCAIVDPHPLYVEGLRAALRRAFVTAVDVTATVLAAPAAPDTAALSAADTAAALPADITIVVIGITGADLVDHAGERVAEVVQRMAHMRPPAVTPVTALRPGSRPMSTVPVMVIADPTDPLPLSDILRAGATCIVDRSSEPDALVQAILRASAGQTQIDAPFTARLAREVASTDAMPVSARELDVLRLMAEGLGNQQIADRLFISLNTVKNHIRSIHEKLGVRSRTAAVSVAVRQGWISYPT